MSNKNNLRVDLLKLACNKAAIELEEFSKNEEEAGTRIVKDAINNIKKNLPELVCLLNILKLYPVNLPINISTDFKHLFFNPKEINRLYKKGSMAEIEFQIMHIIIHGLLGDNESIKKYRQTKVLWLSQDQKVNDLCEKLGYMGNNKKRTSNLETMRTHKPYSACFAKFHIAKKIKEIRKKAKAAQLLINSDEHFFWSPIYVQKVLGKDIYASENNNNENNHNQQQSGFGLSDVDKSWKDAREAILGTNGNNSSNKNKNGSSSENSASDGQSNNEIVNNIVKGRGIGSGRQVSHKKAADGDAKDYREILQELFTFIETGKEIPDSIDPMLYQYGLDLYDDVPLIEPRENDEEKQLDTLVIAVDTSGSCSGTIAEQFMREVKGLLQDAREYINQKEIIIIQCDYSIQNEEHITIDEFEDSSICKGELYGFGGTSFIPVFNRIQQLREEEEIKIGGLIYLSDGEGDFPEEEVDYPTIFVLNSNDYYHAENYDRYIPDWIEVGFIAS